MRVITLLGGLCVLQMQPLAADNQKPVPGKQVDLKGLESTDRIKTFERLAQAGDANGAFCLGQALIEGDGVPKDPAAGLRWITAAAAQEHPSALGYLAWIFAEGQLVPKNEARAFELYSRGAAQGDVYSLRSMGWAYRFGKGCAKDPSKALHWYEAAAKSGDEEALVALGILHEYGEGVPKDLKKASEYYYQAANQQNADGQCRLGWFFLQGLGVEKKPDLAFHLFSESAGQGWARSEGNLGFMYRYGHFVTRDLVMARAWFLKSAEHGDVDSQAALASMFEAGEGGVVDLDEARRWYEKAAASQNSYALMALGNLLLRSAGPEGAKRAKELFLEAAELGSNRAYLMLAMWSMTADKNNPSALQEARVWAEKGVSAGDPAAKVFLGNLLGHGPDGEVEASRARQLLVDAAAQGDALAKWQLGQRLLIEGKTDTKAAAKLFQEASDLGFPPAKLQLGICFQLGRGLPKNPKLALRWIIESAEAGFPEAQFYLSGLYEGGILVPRNRQKAKEWLEKARAAGYPGARAPMPKGDNSKAKTVVTLETMIFKSEK